VEEESKHADLDVEQDTERLESDKEVSRGTGSFVVHGKKASVITFGSELQSLSLEERLRLQRQSQKEGTSALSPATVDDDFHSGD
jgi:hypothetical protein